MNESLIKRTLQTRRVLTFLSMCLRVVSAMLVIPYLEELNPFRKSTLLEKAKVHKKPASYGLQS